MLAVLLAAAAGVSFGASDFGGAIASTRNDAVRVTVAMQLVSLACIAFIVAVFVNSAFSWTDMAWGALGGVGAALGLTMLYKALSSGSMSAPASITGLVGALVPVIIGVGLGEIPTQLQIWGIGIAIPAAVLVSLGSIRNRSLSGSANPRSHVLMKERSAQTRTLAFVSGLGFGLFFIALAQTDSGLYPLLGARFASLGVLIPVLLLGAGSAQRIDRRDLLPVAIAGVLDAGANSLYLLALGQQSANVTWVAPVVSLYPVATVLLARVFLHERLSRHQIIGLGMAAGALWLIAAGAS